MYVTDNNEWELYRCKQYTSLHKDDLIHIERSHVMTSC